MGEFILNTDWIANKQLDVNANIVTTNGKIVWKHRPNWPFYALMLRTKPY